MVYEASYSSYSYQIYAGILLIFVISQDVLPPNAIPISAAFHLKTGSFARLAQATYLTSQALRLAAAIEISGTENFVPLVEDTEQLRRTLEAQVNAAEQEHATRRLSFCCQTMFSYW